MSGASNWGQGETRYFYELSPDRVLDAVERVGVRATGRLLQFNSLENRVYEVEIETEDDTRSWQRKKIIKFYRPGRWSKEQILDEHIFLNDLSSEGIPVAAPEPFEDGSTLTKLNDLDMYCSIFPRVRGRNPDELTAEQFESLGRILARLHNVGESRQSQHRLNLDTNSLGTENLKNIIDTNSIPKELKNVYKQTFEKILDLTEPHLSCIPKQRIHGDCHMGNVLTGAEGLFFVDFDDMLVGPPVQDIWLLTPGRDKGSNTMRNSLISGYQTLRHFDTTQLKLTESLRAMRYVHFSAWIGKRFDDPYFQRTFPNYGTWNYWNEQRQDLEQQLTLIEQAFSPI